MKRRKKKDNDRRFIVTIVIIILAILVGYKLINYYRYTFEKPNDVEVIVKGLKNQKTLKIESLLLYENEYITEGHIKMRNILDGYTKEEETSNKITAYTKEENGKKYIIDFLGEYDNVQLVDSFAGDIKSYGDINLGFLKGDIADADRKGFLDKYNIKNDIDYYKFAADNYYIESNIFTDNKTLKQNYAFNLFTSVVTPGIESWTIIEGDLIGYIFNIGTVDEVNVYQITILDNEKQYGILTTDPRFKDDAFMTDVLRTIKIVNE